MLSPADLWLFASVVFGVVVLPGLDMGFVLGSALVGGRRAGLAAVALAADRVRGWSGPRAGGRLARPVGVILVAAAGVTLVAAWR